MTPYECWAAAGGESGIADADEWRRLMRLHGHSHLLAVAESVARQARKRRLRVVR